MPTYYVTDTGSDSNDGSIGSPWLTISYAVNQVSNGDIIVIDGFFTITSTIVINKQITLTTSSSAVITKTTIGDLFLIQSSNVTMSLLELSQTTSNSADFLINIDRGSSGLTPPIDYTNIRIEACTLNMWKYGICLNGVNPVVTQTSFLRQSGTTERLTCIIAYYINGAEISNNTITDSLRMQRFIYVSSAGTVGSTYFNDVNSKTGLITVINNISSCISSVQGLQFVIQDSFIGSNLSYDVNNNQLNDSVVATKMFVAYISNGTDLNTLQNVSVYNNYQSLTQTGAVLIDSAVAVTVPLTQKFNSYENTGNFSLRVDYSGNINFTQQTANVSPADLANSTIVVYSAGGGGDPHIIDIYGNKTTLPNDWYKFILYKSNHITVIAKAEFIGNWLLNHKLHYIKQQEVEESMTHLSVIPLNIVEIDIYKDFWVTNFTYITEVTIIKNNIEKLVFDTISGFVKYDNSSIIYKLSTTPLLSLTHNIKYPPKNLVAFSIDLEPDVLVISVDNYWDDLNSVIMFPRGSISNKIGELIRHSEENKLK